MKELKKELIKEVDKSINKLDVIIDDINSGFNINLEEKIKDIRKILLQATIKADIEEPEEIEFVANCKKFIPLKHPLTNKDIDLCKDCHNPEKYHK